MQKLHYQTDQEGVIEAADGQLNTLYDDGIKSASSDVFTREILDQYRPDKDHFLQHVIAMGDTETYSFNRNGDGWSKKACETYHPTFVTHGHFFREHKNRDPKQAIGIIKASAYNPKMRRIELVVWGHKKKAEEEYEKAKSGEQLSYSMSARVPNDRCNCCDHVAKRASEYCDHLRYHMTQYIPSFKKYAFAHNDHPTFFDISRVRNPADRIAHYLEYRFGDALEKAASETQVITGTEWAEFEGLSLPDPTAGFDVVELALLHKLAAHETWLDEARPEDGIKYAFVQDVIPGSVGEELDDQDLKQIRNIRPGTLFNALAKSGAVLPFHTFAAYVLDKGIEEVKQDPQVKRATMHLPKVFTNLLRTGGDRSIFTADSGFLALSDAGYTKEVGKVIAKSASAFSVITEHVRRRALYQPSIDKPVITEEEIKSAASVDTESKVLAECYGLYKLSALIDIANAGIDLDEPQHLMIVATNRNIYR